MSTRLAVLSTGMVSAVGMTAAASCAAIRGGIANPTEIKLTDSLGDPFTTHAVAVHARLSPRERMVSMATEAIEECLGAIDRTQWSRVPLLLCVAESSRPGAPELSTDGLLSQMAEALEIELNDASQCIPQGRVGVAVALRHARKLLCEDGAPAVLIAGTDSLLSKSSLVEFDESQRILTPKNSNGFIPGEAAACVLLGKPEHGVARLCVEGLGFGVEPAHIDSEQPLRADGLTNAIRNALMDADCQMHDLDFRITDLSGEHYYFKEAALALTRLLRQRKEEFDIWHPAECIGETGASIGPSLLVVAEAACRKAYAPGPRILLHCSNDAGQRAAVVARYGA